MDSDVFMLRALSVWLPILLLLISEGLIVASTNTAVEAIFRGNHLARDNPPPRASSLF